jgi:hypothetical protein
LGTPPQNEPRILRRERLSVNVDAGLIRGVREHHPSHCRHVFAPQAPESTVISDGSTGI